MSVSQFELTALGKDLDSVAHELRRNIKDNWQEAQDWRHEHLRDFHELAERVTRLEERLTSLERTVYELSSLHP